MSRPASPPVHSSPDAQSTSWSAFLNSKESTTENDPIWTEYVKTASAFDTRIVGDWHNVLDVILVFIALFVSVLTAFIIEASQQFVRNPADITNDILLAIYNKPTNGSSFPEMQISNFSKLDPGSYSQAVLENAMLFGSLAISVIIAMVGLSTKLWLVRYAAEVKSPGSAYDRAMRRQRAYKGLKAWKLATFIDSLPILVLIAVFLFALFVYESIHQNNAVLGYAVATILVIGLTVLLVASFSAAFITSCPFQSPFSDLILFLFDKIFTKNRMLRLAAVTFVSVAVAAATIYLVIHHGGVYTTLVFVPIAGVISAAQKPHKMDNYAPLFTVQQVTLFGTISVVILLAIAANFNASSVPIFAAVSCGAYMLLAAVGYSLNRLTRSIPNTLEAEAVAWLLESSFSQNPSWFKTARQVAKTCQSKALLLKTVLIILPSLVASHRNLEDKVAHEELKEYLSCLAHLSDFIDSEQSFWENKAAIGRQDLPTMLRDELTTLERSGSPRLSNAAAGILRNCGKNGIDKEKEDDPDIV